MKKVLFVDDDPNILAAFQRQMRKNFTVETALGPSAGLAALEQPRDFGVVVADMQMPEMNGVEFLARVRNDAPDIVRVMLTGNADQGTAINAINEGNIFRFLNKPCPPEKLSEALEASMRQHDLIVAERELLENTLKGAVKVLSEILAFAEPKAFGYAEALRDEIRCLADFMRISPAWEIEVAAMLAHIGYVTIPPEVLLKSRVGHTLTGKEQDMFTRIPSIGSGLIANIPRMEEVSRIIFYQKKHFDGSGFPEDPVAGTSIPLGARMLKALLDLTQIESRGASRDAALAQLRARHGWYDPEVLDAVEECFITAAQDAAAQSVESRNISFSDLRVNHTVKAPVMTREGTLIIPAGVRITPILLYRLRNFRTLSGIQEPIVIAG